MASHLIKRTLFALVRAAARLPLPSFLEPVAIPAALLAIALYRRTLSPIVGRDCYFKRTCSHFAADQLKAMGWAAGWRAAVERMSDCGGDYTILTSPDGEPIMKAKSGRRYGGDEIAVRVGFDETRPKRP